MSKILRILDPTMKLDEMAIVSSDNKDSASFSTERAEKQLGALRPFVMINRYIMSGDELTSLYLDETGFMPKCSVTMLMTDGVFLSTAYPKDGDPLSLFIRSKMDEFHPIRMDFTIDNIISSPSLDSEGNVTTYTFQCTMRVPDMFTDFCRSFKGTSFNALKEVARAAKLGFASNETDTKDEMTWIQAFDPTDSFVADVTAASFKDENAFFRTFIDRYYVMNMVNVNAQLGSLETIDTAVNLLERSQDYYAGNDVQREESALVLTNQKDVRGSTAFIQAYTLTSSMGEVLEQNGYRRHVHFYEHFADAEDRPQDQTVESITTQGSTEDVLLQKGRETEKDLYDRWTKHKWMGRQQSRPEGNAHASYKYAVIQNAVNSKEIDKYELKVTLSMANFNIYRGMQVPLVIVTGGAARSDANRQEGQESGNRFTYDRFLSGFYYVKGMRVRWSEYEPQFKHELVLTRREWPKPQSNLRGDGPAPASN
jgi:hypothetical protein